MQEFDYIVVGAGTAGCVLAEPPVCRPKRARCRCSKPAVSDDYWIDIPVGYLYTIGNPRTDWCYD
jgi:choline dehydrogenase